MTNEEAKHEAIKKAFGDKWDLFTKDYQQHLLNNKHWVDMSIKYGAMVGENYSKQPTMKTVGVDPLKCESKHEFWRPIELKGLEDNNGWTRIEPDGSNLPIGNFDFLISKKHNRDDNFLDPWIHKLDIPLGFKEKCLDELLNLYSHFRPRNIKAPIY